MNNPIRVAACGVLEIEGKDREGIFLEGSRDAIKEGARFCGEDVCIVRADFADLARAKLGAAEEMAEAFAVLLAHYVDAANSGDCGFWDPEEEPEIMKSRETLAAWDAAQKGGDA